LSYEQKTVNSNPTFFTKQCDCPLTVSHCGKPDSCQQKSSIVKLDKAWPEQSTTEIFNSMHLKQVITLEEGKHRKGRKVHNPVCGTGPEGGTDGNLQNFSVSSCWKIYKHA